MDDIDDMEIPEMWCIVCEKFVRPLVQCADIKYGGWYCGHHTAQELSAVMQRSPLDRQGNRWAASPERKLWK
jgi:hypothetical protein